MYKLHVHRRFIVEDEKGIAFDGSAGEFLTWLAQPEQREAFRLLSTQLNRTITTEDLVDFFHLTMKKESSNGQAPTERRGD